MSPRKRKPTPRLDTAPQDVTVTDIASLPAEQHGDRAARVRAQQQIAAGEQTFGPASQGGVTPEAVQAAIDGLIDGPGAAIFADTQRPDEPLTAGAAPIMPEVPILPDDPDEPLRGLLAVFPHPDIAALIAARRPNQAEIV